jgi:cystathionine beta-lyase
MALRMERQAQNAARIADFLAAQPLVKSVNYPGLTSHPGAALHAAQATHAGSLLSFETGRRGPGSSYVTLPHSIIIC